MRIALRILVVITLILSGVALFFGIMLFQQREQLKARINILEDSLVRLSTSIETEQAADLAKTGLPTGGVNKKDLKHYYKQGPDGKPDKRMDPGTQKMVKITDGPGTMKLHLKEFEDRTRAQLERLNETRIDLQDTRDSLAETQGKLRDTKSELAKSRGQVEERDDQIADLTAESSQKSVEIETKDEEITDLKGQVQKGEAQIVKLEERQSELRTHIEAQEKHIAEMQEEIERLKQSAAAVVQMVSAGYKGKIMQVNPEWNFVVISIEPDSKLSRGVELIVQREKEFIAKVRVTRVKQEENVAIAEIINEWLQKPIQSGDIVVYQR